MIANPQESSLATATHPQNRVLQEGFRRSSNFFESDQILQHFLKKHTSAQAQAYMQPKWKATGQAAAQEMDALSLVADKKTPELVKRNLYGESLNEIVFHPAYWALVKLAVDSEMFRVKWEPSLRASFRQESHRLGFAANFIYGMSEGGVACPLCMTDGVARLIDRYCEEEDKARLLTHIFTDKAEEFYTGAMFLTEKAGGSDVGANLVSATHIEGKYYALNGEKWFCSNANAQIIFVLARTNPQIKGTKGLSIFLVEPQKPDGSKNTMEIVRLKDKLGVRSMASAECILQNTVGKMVGEEGQGFKIMTDMINLSRLYNATASVAQMRRALVEVYQHLSYRHSFGKPALEHVLIREKLQELNALYQQQFYMLWKAINLLDEADNGQQQAAELLRLLTPMVKKYAAETGVYVIREAMELMGGIGYIEEGIMPKLLRDTLVLPIWEGAGNIMILDMLRASMKSEGLELMLEACKQLIAQSPESLQASLKPEYEALLRQTKAMTDMEQDALELSARYFFQSLQRLYGLALMASMQDTESEAWISPALAYWQSKIQNPQAVPAVANPEALQKMMAWHF